MIFDYLKAKNSEPVQTKNCMGVHLLHFKSIERIGFPIIGLLVIDSIETILHFSKDGRCYESSEYDLFMKDLISVGQYFQHINSKSLYLLSTVFMGGKCYVELVNIKIGSSFSDCLSVINPNSLTNKEWEKITLNNCFVRVTLNIEVVN